MLSPMQTQVAREADLNAALEPTPLPKPLADIVVSYTSDIFDRCMPTLNYFMISHLNRSPNLDENQRGIAFDNVREIDTELGAENIVCRTLIYSNDEIACIVAMKKELIEIKYCDSGKKLRVDFGNRDDFIQGDSTISPQNSIVTHLMPLPHESRLAKQLQPRTHETFCIHILTGSILTEDSIS